MAKPLWSYGNSECLRIKHDKEVKDRSDCLSVAPSGSVVCVFPQIFLFVIFVLSCIRTVDIGTVRLQACDLNYFFFLNA